MAEELSRFQYLKLIVEGYEAIDRPVPGDLMEEWAALLVAETLRKEEDRLIVEEAARMEAAEKKRREEELRNDPQQIALEEYWHNQRQHGRTKAAELWWKKHGQQPWEVEEIKDADERQQRNLAAAKRLQGIEIEHRWDKFREEEGEEPF